MTTAAPPTYGDPSLAIEFAAWFDRIVQNVETVVKGKTDVVRLVLTALLAEGHVLLEDAPGVGKTMLARALAQSLGGNWRRIQFTPDLLPSDVTGVSVFDPQQTRFKFYEGPIFSNVVLADEINRASAKTQSALLEGMAERRVTVDGDALQLPRPFFVLATQNPIELEGTYRLPEAQLDRFLVRTSIGHPDLSTEVDILRSHSTGVHAVDTVSTVLSTEHVAMLMGYAETVHVSEGDLHYVASIAAATRTLPELRLGCSPRGSLGLVRASRVLAASLGRNYVTPEDVQFLAQPVLAHRVILTPEAEMRGTTAAELVERAVHSVPVPRSRS